MPFSEHDEERIAMATAYVERIMHNPPPHRGRWQAGGDPPVLFELKDALAPGGTATAYLLKWGGASYAPDTAVEFEVYDPFSHFRGRAKDAYSSPHDAGSRGIAGMCVGGNGFLIQEMLTPHALMILGQATAAYAGSDFSIDNLEVMQPIGGIITTADPATSISLTNLSGLAGDDNDKMIGLWDEANDRYIAVLPHFSQVTVQTNYQIDTANREFEKKTRTAYVMEPGTESGWTVVHTGTACS
jgi:hypothetical protein